jgi:DnaK suppressor protein
MAAAVDAERLRTRLLERRAELLHLMESARDSTRPVAFDPGVQGRLSRADALEQQAVALQAERRRQAELARINAALRRIEAGDYGWCAVCGYPIPERRLELDPTTATCAAKQG